ncbi:MAG TPA: hypothetical protein VIT22_11420 [Pseudoxanthomonas sp.]
MNALPQLWLPILVAAVLVYIASALIHMVFKWHNNDYRKLANEEEVQAALRKSPVAPGLYTVPHCADMKAMRDEAVVKKFVDGPVVFVTVFKSGPPKMGGMLLRWFLFNLTVATATAAIALQIYGVPGNGHAAAHLIGLITFLTYAGGSVSSGIWMGKPWISVLKDLLDALIYGIVSALAFWWLWPA